MELLVVHVVVAIVIGCRCCCFTYQNQWAVSDGHPCRRWAYRCTCLHQERWTCPRLSNEISESETALIQEAEKWSTKNENFKNWKMIDVGGGSDIGHVLRVCQCFKWKIGDDRILGKSCQVMSWAWGITESEVMGKWRNYIDYIC